MNKNMKKSLNLQNSMKESKLQIKNKIEDILLQMSNENALTREFLGVLMLQYGINWLYASGLSTDNIKIMFLNFLNEDIK